MAMDYSTMWAVSIAAIIFSSVNLCSSQYDWHPPRVERKHQAGQLTTIFTVGERQTGHFDYWYVVNDRFSFSFGVRACHSAVVGLSKAQTALDDMALEILIGVGDNQITGLRSPYQVGFYVQANTSDILHCDEFRYFWIRWKHNTIRFGRGPTPLYQEIFSWEDRDERVLLNVGLNSVGVPSMWEVYENTGEFLIMDMADERLHYSTIWKEVEQTYFYMVALRGCFHKILLARHHGEIDRDVYEIVIGADNNTRALIRSQVEGGEETYLAVHDEGGMARCDDTEFYWVSWYHDAIEVGIGGLYGAGTFLTYVPERMLDINYMSFSPGSHHRARYQFVEDNGPMNIISTEPQEIESNRHVFGEVYVLIPRKEFIMFSHRVCPEDQLHVQLSPNVNDNNVLHNIEIIFGANNNTEVHIKHLDNILQSAPRRQSVRCDSMNMHWLSWHQGVIEVGDGVVYGSNGLLKVELPQNNPPAFQTVSFATPNTSANIFFRDDTGEQVRMVTPARFTDFDHMMRTTGHQEYISFRLKACEEGHVTLLPVLGIGDQDYYDLVISEEGTWTYVRKVIDRNTSLAENVTEKVNTTGLLGCDQTTDLWLSWWDGRPTFGRGRLPVTGQILSMDRDQVSHVAALSVSTGDASEGMWTFHEDNGDEFITAISTNSMILVDKNITWIRLSLTSCGESVYIDLSEELDLGIPEPIENFEKYMIVFNRHDGSISLRIRGRIVMTKPIGDVLSCYDETDIWIEWSSELIHVGSGSLRGENSLLLYTDGHNRELNLTVNAIALHEDNRNDRGTWRIYQNVGQQMLVKTPGGVQDPSYLYAWRTVRHTNHFRFAVYGCSNARLLLSNRATGFTEDMVEIRLGTRNNTMTDMIIHGEDWVLQETNTPGILNCSELRPFWMTWQTGGIRVGEGEKVHEKLILSFFTLHDYEIESIGFSTSDPDPIIWSFLLNSHKFPAMPTPTPPPTPSPTPTPPADGGSGGLGGGAIAGIIIGVIVAVLLTMVLVHLVFKWRTALGLPTIRFSRRNESNQPPADEPERTVMPDLPITVMTEPYERFG